MTSRGSQQWKSGDARRRVPGFPGTFWFRENHTLAHDRRPGIAHGRRNPDWWTRGQQSDPARAPDRHGLPELRALSPSDGLQEHCFSVESTERTEKSPQTEGGMGGVTAGYRRATTATTPRPFPPPAAAGGVGPGHRPATLRAPARPAALQP